MATNQEIEAVARALYDLHYEATFPENRPTWPKHSERHFEQAQVVLDRLDAARAEPSPEGEPSASKEAERAALDAWDGAESYFKGERKYMVGPILRAAYAIDRPARSTENRERIARMEALETLDRRAHERLDELGVPTHDDNDLPPQQSVHERIGHLQRSHEAALAEARAEERRLREAVWTATEALQPLIDNERRALALTLVGIANELNDAACSRAASPSKEDQ